MQQGIVNDANPGEYENFEALATDGVWHSRANMPRPLECLRLEMDQVPECL